jgi:hypothetical protein
MGDNKASRDTKIRIGKPSQMPDLEQHLLRQAFEKGLPDPRLTPPPDNFLPPKLSPEPVPGFLLDALLSSTGWEGLENYLKARR